MFGSRIRLARSSVAWVVHPEASLDASALKWFEHACSAVSCSPLPRVSRAAVLSIVLACAVLLTPRSGEAFSASNPARVLYVGDSLAAETRSTVAGWVHLTGKATVTTSTLPAMALCDYLEGRPAGTVTPGPANRLAARVRSDRPHLVALQFWGNAATPCMGGTIERPAPVDNAYFERYFLDAAQAVSEITAAAADVGIERPKILWVRQGPEVPGAVPQTRTQTLNAIYDWMAGHFADRTSDAGFGVSLAHATGSVTDRYGWTQRSPCTDLEKNLGYCTFPSSSQALLHRDADRLHFCLGTHDLSGQCSLASSSPGIFRYGARIAGDINTWLGLLN